MERLVEVEQISFEEENTEISLRPSNWDDYIGQEKIKKNLKVFIEASRKRKEALDHILFYGPPGLGKTTLSYLISNEMNTNPDRLDLDFHNLCFNPNAIHLLERKPNEISWCILSGNPNAIHLLEQNRDKIFWPFLSKNPGIFEGDYACK